MHVHGNPIFHSNFAVIRKALAVNISSKIFDISEYLVENYCSVLNIIISLSFCLGSSIKIWEIIEIEREKRQEIDHQRRPQNSRWRRSCDQNHGLSKMKIDDVSVKFGYNPGHTDSVKEGTIFMGLLVLFGVFNQVLKCLGP